MDKYGVEHHVNSAECKLKMKEKCGEEYFVKSKAFKDICMERYGAPHFSQSVYAINGYKWKDYKLPSGKIIRIQGYENFLLDELLEDYTEHQIFTNRSDMPEFWYELDGAPHRYFPDVYIPETNTIYEVKSAWTVSLNLKKNEKKFRAVKDACYNFKLKVY